MCPYNLGFLTVQGDSENHSQMASGVFDAAAQHDARVLRLSTKIFAEHFEKFNDELHQLCRVIETQKLDGLMFLGWMPGLTGKYFSRFRAQFSHLPLVSLGRRYEDLASVFADPREAVTSLMEHLISEHGYRDIVYIPPRLADERLEVYRQTMQKHGLYRDDLVFPQNILQNVPYADRMMTVVDILFEPPESKPVDAIIVMFESDAETLLWALKQKGIRVPEDVAIISFEDTEFASFSLPPLTTITFPWWDVGFQGCTKLVQILRRQDPPSHSAVQPELIIRNSCGCGMQSTIPSLPRPASDIESKAGPLQTGHLLQSNLHDQFEKNHLDLEPLLAKLVSDVKKESVGQAYAQFARQLETVLTQYPYLDRIEEIDEMLLNLRKEFLPSLFEMSQLLQAEEIFWDMLSAVRSKIPFAIGYRDAQSQRVNQQLHYISQDLIRTDNIEDLLSVLEAALIQQQIPSCYILLHTESSPTGYHLIFQYEKHARHDLKAKAVEPSFLADTLLPQFGNLLCQLLFVNGEYYGIIAFEPYLSDLRIYQSLSIHISSAAKNVLLVEKLNQEIRLRQDKEDQLQFSADHDMLTGLFNRRHFNQVLNHWTENDRSQAWTPASFHLVFVDFDDFKHVNDRHGHDVGDLLIRAIARRILHGVRDKKFDLASKESLLSEANTDDPQPVFRLGGDEFTVLLPDLGSKEMLALAEKLKRALASPYCLAGKNIRISASIGISFYPKDAANGEDLLKAADTAMYRAKEEKNAYRFYQDLASSFKI